MPPYLVAQVIVDSLVYIVAQTGNWRKARSNGPPPFRTVVRQVPGNPAAVLAGVDEVFILTQSCRNVLCGTSRDKLWRK
jgi:hypothetical protein